MYGSPGCCVVTLAALQTQHTSLRCCCRTESHHCFLLSKCQMSVKTYGLHFSTSPPMCEVSLMLQFRFQFLPCLLEAPKMEVPMLFDSFDICIHCRFLNSMILACASLLFPPYNFHVVFQKEQRPEIMLQYPVWLQFTCSIGEKKKNYANHFRPVL